jgi:hypothetical protein
MPESTELDLDRTSGFITEGTHLFRIEGSKEQGSKSSGIATWYFDCICQDAGEDRGKKFSLILSLAPAARFKVDQFFDALEMPRQGKFRHEQAVGKSLKIVIQHGEYNGNPNMNAYRMLPANSTVQVEVPHRSESGEGPRSPELNSSGKKSPF